MGKMILTPVTNQKYPLELWARNLGMYEVTEKNWHEFFVRIRLYEQWQGVSLLKYSDSNEPVEITPELAKQHVGCRLGDKMEDRNTWWVRIMSGQARSLEYEVEQFAPDVEFPRSNEL